MMSAVTALGATSLQDQQTLPIIDVVTDYGAASAVSVDSQPHNLQPELFVTDAGVKDVGDTETVDIDFSSALGHEAPFVFGLPLIRRVMRCFSGVARRLRGSLFCHLGTFRPSRCRRNAKRLGAIHGKRSAMRCALCNALCARLVRCARGCFLLASPTDLRERTLFWQSSLSCRRVLAQGR